MISTVISTLLAIVIFVANSSLKELSSEKYQSPLVCVNKYVNYFSFGNSPQIADMFWIRFLQELDAFNQYKIAEVHLCPDKASSWHFHIMSVAMDLDPNFYDIALNAPLLISVTIGDSIGASELFDKAVRYYPNDWKILYRASYQAQIEEKNYKKAAELLYRAGKNGAPSWVLSLAGGFFNETGDRAMAERIYAELLAYTKDEEVAKRLKSKLDSKIKNFFNQQLPENKEPEKK